MANDAKAAPSLDLALFRDLVETSPDGVVVLAEGQIVFVNAQTERLFGYRRDELLGQPLEILIPERFREAHAAHRDAYLDAPRFRQMGEGRNLAGRRKDGTEFPADIMLSSLQGARGPIVQAVVRDLTERRQVEKKLGEVLERNAFFDTLLDHMPAMVVVKDAADLRLVFLNRSGEQFLGNSRDRSIGKTAEELLPKEQAEASRARDREALDGARLVENLEEPLDTPDGRRWFHTWRLPLRDDEGRPSHLLGIWRDITEQRQAKELLRRSEDQLRQAQKMDAIGNLAGGVAHDFNNLLSVILSYASLLSTDLKASDPIRADILEIEAAAKRGADLTRQLLAFGRRQVVQPRPLDLNDVVQGLQTMLRRLLGEGIELTALHTPGLGTVMVDEGQVEQIVVNLAVNARDAMPRGGKLTIEVGNAELEAEYAERHVGVTPGPHVALIVSDTGTGMDAATKARLFEPFFTTKEMGKGTGLGLATVHGMVKQGGGHIWVYSEPGEGTTMKVYFPRTDLASVKTSVSSLPPVSTLRGTETILLVEDEEPVRVLTRTILRRHGYHVLDAASGGDALLLCEQHGATIHLMLTDVVMPRMSGRQLADRLKTIRPEMKVLYMSGYTDNSIVHHGVLDSGVAFLQKPVTPESLTRKVREVLDAAT